MYMIDDRGNLINYHAPFSGNWFCRLTKCRNNSMMPYGSCLLTWWPLAWRKCGCKNDDRWSLYIGIDVKAGVYHSVRSELYLAPIDSKSPWTSIRWLFERQKGYLSIFEAKLWLEGLHERSATMFSHRLIVAGYIFVIKHNIPHKMFGWFK